ncbi:glycosyltransferase [Bacteroides sp.]
MKILLIGEFSNIHWTLAEGLRILGHEVCVVSDGNHWKNYKRDISLVRPTNNKIDGIKYMVNVLLLLPQLKGYDIVQIVNPCFLNLKPQKSLPIYRFLKRHNKKVFLGAFGTDHYYVKACMETDVFKYSDFKSNHTFRDTQTNRTIVKECLHGGTARANIEIAQTCNGIIACLWEYYVSYIPNFLNKTTFIPLPIDYSDITSRVRTEPEKVNFFIGIQSARSDIKGTDIMYPILKKVQKKYPYQCCITEAIDVPYTTYQQLMDSADVQLDQLYSYTPSMNSLLAMAKGVIVVGGGEEENYEIINEKQLRPIINVYPTEEDIYQKLEYIVLNKKRIPELSAQSIEYVRKHHNHIKVAQQYVDFWETH